MADDYDAKAKPRAYRHLDAVGVRIPGKNPRKGHLHNCLPCLVVDVREERRRAGTRVVVHRMYTVWCPFGVLSNKLKVDKLVSLSINNFPALLPCAMSGSLRGSGWHAATPTGSHRSLRSRASLASR